MIRPTFTALCLIFLVAGCATKAQQKAQTIALTIKATLQASHECFEKVNSDPQFSDLNEHFPINDVTQASLPQQAANSFATPHEIALLSDRLAKLKPCRDAQIKGLMITPPVAITMMNFYTQADAITLALAKKNITWGDYVTRQKALSEALRPKITSEFQQIGSSLDAENQMELQQRAAAAQAFSNAMYREQLLMQNQQMINNMNQPTTTSCNRFGNTINCISN